MRGIAGEISVTLSIVKYCTIKCYMKRDSRLSGILHVLLHLAEQDGPMTSAALARAMRTNPVVVRRTLSGLRKQGYVCSEKGHGGGWSLGPKWKRATLRDIYEALDCPSIFAMGNRTDEPDCLVEQTVNAALNDAFGQAEKLLLKRFGGITLQELSIDFHALLINSPARHRKNPPHGP